MDTHKEVISLVTLIFVTGAVLISSLLFALIESYKQEKKVVYTVCGTPDPVSVYRRTNSLSEPLKANILQGHELFENNCQQCHAVNKKVVGPALQGVESRWSDQNTLISFIKYPEKMIIGGNEYAQKLHEEYGQMMPNHDFMNDEQIKSILTYIKFESGETLDTPTTADSNTEIITM